MPQSGHKQKNKLNQENSCLTETKPSFKPFIENIENADFVYQVTKGKFIYHRLFGFNRGHETYWLMEIDRRKQHGYEKRAEFKLYTEISHSFICKGRIDQDGEFMTDKTESHEHFKIKKSETTRIK